MLFLFLGVVLKVFWEAPNRVEGIGFELGPDIHTGPGPAQLAAQLSLTHNLNLLKSP